MRKTLLKIVQDILSDMNDDEVNSINDTVESLQVATIVKNTYEFLFDNEVIPSREGLVKLSSLADVERPNIMKIPDNVQNVYWIKYDIRDPDTITISGSDWTLNESTHLEYTDVKYTSPENFVKRTVQFLNQDNTMQVKCYPNDVLLTIKSDSHPQFWTTFDNVHVIFDSFDNSVESTLQQSKSLCFGQYIPDFRLEDTFVPDLDPNLFSLLYNESKAACFIDLKQVSNSKAEQRSRHLNVKRQNDRWRLNQNSPLDLLPDYGRRSRV